MFEKLKNIFKRELAGNEIEFSGKRFNMDDIKEITMDESNIIIAKNDDTIVKVKVDNPPQVFYAEAIRFFNYKKEKND